MYDLNYFINFFSEIPENKWTEDTFFGNGLENKRFLGFKLPGSYKMITTCCAQGHCIDEKDQDEFLHEVAMSDSIFAVSRSYPKLNALLNLTQDPEDGQRITIAIVNNGDNPNYQQETPKQRVVAFLYDLLAKEYDKKYITSEEQFSNKREEIWD